MGGLSGSDGVLDPIVLVKSIQFALKPHVIVIKSMRLQNLTKHFTPYWKWLKDTAAATTCAAKPTTRFESNNNHTANEDEKEEEEDN